MKWLILLSLFACSSQNTQNKEASAATESSAKPVQVKEIKSCICNKIFMPVCADGINYGNTCEAQCQGHKKWTQGSCQSPKKK